MVVFSRQDELRLSLTVKRLVVAVQKHIADKLLAADVVHEAIVKALSKTGEFHLDSIGYRKLYIIAKRTAFGFNKSNDNIRKIHNVSISWRKRMTVEFAELRMNLEAAMKILSVENHRIMYDYYYVGYTIDEIAERMNMARSTVHKRIHRNLQKMREFLEDR